MTHYDAPAEHVIVGCHHSVLSIIRAVLLLCVVELQFFFVKINIFYTSRYLVLISLWIGRYITQHPTDQYTHHEVQEIRSFMLALFFCPIYTYFCALRCQARSLS